MNWLNIKTSQLRNPEFTRSSTGAKLAWICVMSYCTEQETGGRIVGARHWKERQWERSCGVSSKQVNSAEALLRWEGDDLVVWGYPEARDREVARLRELGQSTSERKAAAARENGKLGGRPPKPRPAPELEEPSVEDLADDDSEEVAEFLGNDRWPTERFGRDEQDEPGKDDMAECESATSDLGAAAAENHGETHETQQKPIERKGKEREIEKEKKGEGESKGALRATPAPVEQPTEEEFISECARFLVPAEFARDRFLAQSAKGWLNVRDWRALARRVKGWFEGEKSTWLARAVAAPAGGTPRGNGGSGSAASFAGSPASAFRGSRTIPPVHANFGETL